jgi:acetyltransferase-like isoleucine patch superfamily enzyme
VHGIIDDDYAGAGVYKGIPVIGAESLLAQDPLLQPDFQFICATNWVADDYPVAERNRIKRQRQIQLIEELGLRTATLVAPLATVSAYARLGMGVIVWDHATLEPEVTVGNHSQIYDYAVIGHETTIGSNVVIQRYCLVTSLVTIEDQVYLGLRSAVARSDVCICKGTFLHPEIMLLRSTHAEEVVGLAGKDLRKVYHRPSTEQ